MKKQLFLSLVCAVIGLGLFSCSSTTSLDQASVDQDTASTALVNQEVGKIMSIAAKAAQTKDPAVIAEFQQALSDFDAKYDSDLSASFNQSGEASPSRITSSDNYPPLTDLPLNQDGAVYLSGGGSSALGLLLTFVSPKATAGKYYHGASLEKRKFDPSNLDAPCFQTAVEKGAGYESARDWMVKANVAVFNPSFTMDYSKLYASQNAMDYYCSPNNTSMQYGFFKDYANIFSVVTKADNYYWYCTKVVWRIYNSFGVDIDSNTPKIDWTTSGLYSMVKAIYFFQYPFNSSKRNSMINAYINNTKNNLVLAEEIYFTPNLSKVYEKIRK